MKKLHTRQPKLRFPEFVGDWNTQRCDEVLKRTAISVSVTPENLYQEIGIRSHGRGVFHKEETLGAALGNKRVFEVVPNTLAFNIVFAWEQAVAILTDAERGLIASHRFPMYSDVEDLSNIDFLRYFFLRPRGKHLLELASPGGAGRNKTLGQANFAELSIPIPSINEQEKIAAFINHAEKKVELLTQKKALLVDYKNACMQQLFSQKLRFKDDQNKDFPRWKKKKLHELADKVNEKNHSTKITSVLTNSAVRGIISQGDYFERDVASAENLDRYTIVEFGDFVYNPRISVSAPVGPIKRNNLRQGVMSPLYDVFRFKDAQTDFWEQYFSSSEWHRYMKQVANYGARHDRMAISSQDFMDMPLPYPSLQEQEKIADFLSNIDTRIKLASDEHSKARDFYKGLLQQMFV